MLSRNFLKKGALLKEWNNTIISLIPKTATPSKVTDYRPISCCNVLYKCISKILSDRLKDSLVDIINENQSAFVPGRQISDNILLSQELMKNYHIDRGISRCAFKVDIQKAYDTVDWGFLSLILKSFGFHEKFVKWIMICVTHVHYTINVNGELHGFFEGRRGLRKVILFRLICLLLLRKFYP